MKSPADGALPLRAWNSGATRICIANYPDTPITRAADIHLMTASFQTQFESDRTVSPISQLAILDALFMGVFLLRHRSFKGRIAVIEEALSDKLY